MKLLKLLRDCLHTKTLNELGLMTWQEPTDMSNHYTVYKQCFNCGYAGKVYIRKGTPKYGTTDCNLLTCPRCENWIYLF